MDFDRTAKSALRTTSSTDWLYYVLAAFMLSYIFRFPATYKIGWVAGHYETFNNLESVPSEYWTKLEDAPWLRWVHTFPVALWLVLGMSQFATSNMGHYSIHRVLGRLFGLCSVVIWLGLWFMIQENAGLFIPLIGRKLTGFYNLWFGMTMVVAWNHARNKRIALHRRWMKRHIWAGMAPVVQRIFHLAAYNAVKATGVEFSKMDMFGASALICFAAMPIICEIGLTLGASQPLSKEL